MKKICSPVILFLLVFCMAGCRKNLPVSSDQEILFQMDYLNYAWGYQHYGFMIDNQGRILLYDNPETWNFPDENFILTEEQIAENISMCRISGERIPEEQLIKYSSYIENIAASKITALRNTGADAGTLEFICYRFSESSHMYKGFLIRTEGDYTAENLNFYSKKVVAWMKGIEQTVSSK